MERKDVLPEDLKVVLDNKLSKRNAENYVERIAIMMESGELAYQAASDIYIKELRSVKR